MTVQTPQGKRVLFISTYPPTRCGIATFTESLVSALKTAEGERSTWDVARLVGGADEPSTRPEVVTSVDPAESGWVGQIVETCQDYDLLWIQHEYGIFGPDDGVGVLDLCQETPLPLAVTLHTVAARPSRRQRRILEGMIGAAEFAVVMSNEARRRLLRLYGVEPSKVQVVPHGADTPRSHTAPPPPGGRPRILNWGLIGPGKGLEWAIRAMALLRHLDPPPLLVIRGSTHPNVQRREGESYRDRLSGLVSELGLEAMVEIEDSYLSADELDELIRGSQMVLLPYDSTEQVTSGVLVEAVAAGLPVVATAFPHAVEVLSAGAGFVVPHRDPVAMAAAIERLVTEPTLARLAASRARHTGHAFAWPRVARRYQRLAMGALDRLAASVA